MIKRKKRKASAPSAVLVAESTPAQKFRCWRCMRNLYLEKFESYHGFWRGIRPWCIDCLDLLRASEGSVKTAIIRQYKKHSAISYSRYRQDYKGPVKSRASIEQLDSTLTMQEFIEIFKFYECLMCSKRIIPTRVYTPAENQRQLFLFLFLPGNYVRECPTCQKKTAKSGQPSWPVGQYLPQEIEIAERRLLEAEEELKIPK